MRGILVVDVIENLAGRLRNQLRENLLNRVEVSIKIQVLLLDIQNERVLRVKKRDGAVALVSFGNEIFATRVPMRVGSENWNLGANVMRWMHPAFAQDVRGHC